MYFLFLTHFIVFSAAAGVLGIFTVLPHFIELEENLHTTYFAVYCIGIVLLATIFVEYWKRT
jgi:hypothetical protein